MNGRGSVSVHRVSSFVTQSDTSPFRYGFMDDSSEPPVTVTALSAPIIALVSKEARARLDQAVQPGCSWRWTASPAELLRYVKIGGSRGVVVDPGLIDAQLSRDLGLLLVKMSCPLVLYAARLEPCGMVNAVALGGSTSSSLLVLNFNDDMDSLSSVLTALPDPSPIAAFLEMLRPVIARLPVSMWHTIEALVARSNASNSPNEIAAQSCLTRRSVDRALQRAGVRSAAQLVNTARIVRAFGPLRNPTLPISRIAAILGVASQRALNDQCIAVTGSDIAALRRMSGPTELLERISAHLFIEGKAVSAIRK